MGSAKMRLHLRTLYLFTYSDMKTILFPVTIFASLAAPKTHASRLPHTIFWTWIHLLQFCVSNQSISPEEDAANKPWRPIPARRLSVRQAKLFRWILLPLCLAVSASYSVTSAGAALAVGIWAHNELGLHAHWFTRNVCNALGYAAFDNGATLVACTELNCRLDTPAMTAHIIVAFIILTTIHAQDFQDAEGDALFLRRTIPLVMPAVGRLSLLILLSIWSIILSVVWKPGALPSVLFIGLGSFVGFRFVQKTTKEADRKSYLLYNVWLSFAQVLLFHSRDA